ncbi:hypothetical protein [Lacihabitans soyangensis]|uniref:Uncharacterized protein n=1 Tax=Lacihabitans soyangensis TaxID=869394 RepID=A0AAE3H205_9BACT|nr:hypothetical protein [Lacihabitans soyangensis]MCP9761370.1 hypothetical protein [Lacihabitans soyangensis]
MSIFTKGNLQGLKVYIEKSNWKMTLNFIQEHIFGDNFFFFFDTDRGHNLSIFSEEISEKDIKKLADFIEILPYPNGKQSQDPIFENFPSGSLVKIDKISNHSDIQLINPVKEAISFQKNLSAVLIGALNYNDFFIEEKNRINIALQLAFLAMVRANFSKIISSAIITNPSAIQKEVDPDLMVFFEELQDIENEENIEPWVINWIELTKETETLEEINYIQESVCQALEIRTFAPKITETLLSILTKIHSK